MDSATSLRLTAASTTSTVSATFTSRQYTPTPRAATLTAPISMDVVIITAAFVRTTALRCSVMTVCLLVIAGTPVLEHMTTVLDIVISTMTSPSKTEPN